MNSKTPKKARSRILESIDLSVKLYVSQLLVINDVCIVNDRLNLPLITQMDNGRLVSKMLLKTTPILATSTKVRTD